MSLLNIKRLSLTVLFMFLTLSIGLVTVDSPLTVNAQNNALSQNDGAGAAEQETKQGQSSNQDSQAISGKSSVLSGNNLQCQNQVNSLINIDDEKVCVINGSESDISIPNFSQNILTVSVKAGSDTRIQSTVTVTDIDDGDRDSFLVFPAGPPVIKNYIIPVGHTYSIEVRNNIDKINVDFIGPCQAGPDSGKCIGQMNPSAQNVLVLISRQ